MAGRVRTRFPGRVGLQQRVLPTYRAAFFDRLAELCDGGLGVFAGAPRPEEGILSAVRLDHAVLTRARNLHVLRGPAYLCLQGGLLRWLEAWDPAVLILEPNPRYLSSGRAISWMQRRGRPVIGWGLGAPDMRGAGARIRRWLRGRFLRRFDAMIAYSSLAAEQYRAAGIARTRVFVAYNAAAAPPPPRPPRPTASGRPLRLLFVGRLQARKRVEVLLQACAPLGPPPELRIVGDGPARPSLERTAARVFPATRFSGSLQGAALAEAYDQADLFVLPGTGGLAVQEAMAHALPVIVAEGDGTQFDLVRPGNGWLVTPGDIDGLIAVLREAIRDPGRLPRMGAESHRIVAEEINIETMADAFVAALGSVAGMVS